MKTKYVTLLIVVLSACQSYKNLPTLIENSTWKTQDIAASVQSKTGNSEMGYKYLIEGDYIGSGTPYGFMKNKMLKKPDTILARSADNQYAFYTGNVFKTSNGTKVFAENCFTCHSSTLNGKVVLGLGNSLADFKKSKVLLTKFVRLAIKIKYRKDSPERQAFQPFASSIKVLPPYIITNNSGVNPAFRLEEACTIYRNPIDLLQIKKANFKLIKYTLASDTPPLWNVAKKNAFYYNGMGRGSMTKLLMQASLLGIPDTTTARKVHDNFDDVLAWLKTITPPSYPKEIDKTKLLTGEAIFEKHCSNCHGTYGPKSKYPNKLVALHIVKTDPHYAQYFSQKSHLVEWYNKSWFANSFPKSSLQAENGYIAPPLDGIWASAPYLHNGSVPTLEDLLNSSQRPVRWKRSQSSFAYDYQKVGWKYSIPSKSRGKNIYDTQLLGYGNGGHSFGDKLNNEERTNLIEYLKSL